MLVFGSIRSCFIHNRYGQVFFYPISLVWPKSVRSHPIGFMWSYIILTVLISWNASHWVARIQPRSFTHVVHQNRIREPSRISTSAPALQPQLPLFFPTMFFHHKCLSRPCAEFRYFQLASSPSTTHLNITIAAGNFDCFLLITESRCIVMSSLRCTC